MKKLKKNKPSAKYDVNNEPLVTSKVTFDILLKQDRPGDLLALYLFYYYTAKWQGSMAAKAVTSYAANGLKWSEDRVRKNKKQLIKLGLIEDITKRDSKTGQVEGHFILVKFIWNAHPLENPESGEPHSLGNSETNALRKTSRLNALRTNNKNIFVEHFVSTENDKEKENENKTKYKLSKQLKLATKLSKIIQTKKNIKHTKIQLKKWAVEIHRLEKSGISLPRQKAVLNWYSTAIGGEYIPVIESGSTWREKFSRLESAIEREEKAKTNTTRTSGYRRKDGHVYKNFDEKM